MATLRIDHQRCTECRMCYIVCREIDLNAVYVALEPLHRIEIDIDKCTYPGCTACLMYCPAEGSIVEAETGRSMVPPPPEAWQRRHIENLDQPTGIAGTSLRRSSQ